MVSTAYSVSLSGLYHTLQERPRYFSRSSLSDFINTPSIPIPFSILPMPGIDEMFPAVSTMPLMFLSLKLFVRGFTPGVETYLNAPSSTATTLFKSVKSAL